MKFSYVQIGARDVTSLAQFYIDVLGCRKSTENKWLCGKPGTVLSLPGFGEDAPVLGIVECADGDARNINDTGFAHLCFETEDVKAAVTKLLKNGGSLVSTMKHAELHPCVYCRDPEGNIVEFHIPFPAKGTAPEYLTTAGSLLGLKRGKTALKFIHVNIITTDWRKLCDFYNGVFGCTDTGKLKDHQGSYKEQVIGIPGVHVIGRHVLLPGFFESYPTLEIFTYSIPGIEKPNKETDKGINCIGFASSGIDEDAKTLISAGGSKVSEENGISIFEDIQGDRILIGG